MGDYFDDDDLINEYMEEEFEPPPEYDEGAFLEAELGAAEKNDDAPKPMQEDSPPEEQDDDAQNVSTENNMEVPTSVTIKPPERKADVYSFER